MRWGVRAAFRSRLLFESPPYCWLLLPLLIEETTGSPKFLTPLFQHATLLEPAGPAFRQFIVLLAFNGEQRVDFRSVENVVNCHFTLFEAELLRENASFPAAYWIPCVRFAYFVRIPSSSHGELTITLSPNVL